MLQSGQPFITWFRLARPLEIEANVAADENGFVHVDDPVSIKFETSPFSQYGLAEGHVRTVSLNSFNAAGRAAQPDEFRARQRGRRAVVPRPRFA